VNQVTLRSGDRLACGHVFGESQWIELERSGEATQRIELRFPHAGIGAQELVLSPDERLAAMCIRSNQGDGQGYELFELIPVLRHVGRAPYRQGQGDAPRFSPDGRWLVMLTKVAPMCGSLDAEEFLGCGDSEVEWAELHVHEVPHGERDRWRVTTLMPAELDVELAKWSLNGAWQFSAADRVTVMLPWGARLEVALPPPAGTIRTEPFAAGQG
jgi:hypothetical protein